jgi:hypothetical protein
VGTVGLIRPDTLRNLDESAPVATPILPGTVTGVPSTMTVAAPVGKAATTIDKSMVTINKIDNVFFILFSPLSIYDLY